MAVSAYSFAHPEPSHTMLTMGLSRTAARSSFRFILGELTTKEEVDRAAQLIIESDNAERAISPMRKMINLGVDLS